MIPKEKIEEIRMRADIVEVVSSYVALKRRGANHIGPCPFHNEKTPSFTVNEDKGIYYCFGCGAGGNVISFLMKHEGLAFPEALRSLASRYGITITEEKRSPRAQAEARKKKSEEDSMIELNRIAMGFFRERLRSELGNGARSYLQERGFTGDIEEDFRIGLAPEGWEGLSGFLKSKGYDRELAMKAGLLGKKDARFFDRFRGRIIFPITDFKGKVIAFGARSLDGEEPKYLNSPESSLFKKSETLYGYFKAKDEIRKKEYVIVVEGYFDVIALHKYGFKNCVATMGTALTPSHISRLKRQARKIYLLFDADHAGKKAALRGLELFLEQEISAKVITVPEGKDPDDFLKSEGASSMERAIKEAVPLMEFFLSDLGSKFNLKTAEGKGDFLNEATPFLKKIKNVAELGHYVTLASSMLGLDGKIIYDSIGGEGVQIPKSGDSRNTLKGTRKPSVTKLAELTLLKIIILHPEFFDEEVKEIRGFFNDEFLKKVSDFVWSTLEASKGEAGSILESALSKCESVEDEAVKGFIAEALVTDDKGFINSPKDMIVSCMEKLRAANGPGVVTKKLLKILEEGGKEDVARDIMGERKPTSRN
ncbi:MAG: DNA primase [Deltaproteobacteria bacterium]|nr:DNA primase [Deltaproteobacteria bacterium]